MIKYLKVIDSFKDDNLFLIRIKSNSLCYQNYDFCRTFLQQNHNEITAYINILDKSSTIFAKETSDFTEIKDFLKFKGVSSVFCNQVASDKLDLKEISDGIVLKFCGKLGNKEDKTPVSYNPNYKFIYDLMKDEFPMPCYNEFVSDLSFRLKFGFSRIIENSKGVIFTGWETETKSVISAVAVSNKERRSGVGTSLLNSMINNIKNKEIFVFCTENLKNFYEKNGFKPVDRYFWGRFS